MEDDGSDSSAEDVVRARFGGAKVGELAHRKVSACDCLTVGKGAERALTIEEKDGGKKAIEAGGERCGSGIEV